MFTKIYAIIEKRKVYLFQIAARILPQVLGLLVGISIVRNSGAEMLGRYALILSVFNLSFSVVSGGVRTNLLRSSTANSYGPSLLAMMFFWVLFLPVVLLAGQLLLVPLAAIACMYFGFLMVNYSELLMVKTRLLNADIKAIFPRTLAPIVFLVLLVIVKPKTMIEFSFTYLASWSCLLFFIIPDFSYIKKVTKKIEEVRKLVLPSIILAASLFATQVFVNVDQIMISKMLSVQEGGYYRIAFSFSKIIAPTAAVFSFVFLSGLKAKIDAEEFLKIRRIFRRQLVFNSALGVVVIFFSLLLNPVLLPMLYGAEALAAVYCSVLLSVSTAVNLLTSLLAYTLLGFLRDTSVLYVLLANALLNVVLNYFLIPTFGIEGAAYASIATQCLVCLSYFIILRKVNLQLPVSILAWRL